MSKKKKKNHRDFLSDRREGVSAEEREIKRQAFKKNRRYLIPLALNTIIFYALYAVLSNTNACVVILWVYAAALVGFSLAYIIYNRGLSRKNITIDMLPSTMSLDEKQAFLNEITRRADKSKWMITVIFPLVITFLIDTVVLYLAEPIIEKLGI